MQKIRLLTSGGNGFLGRIVTDYLDILGWDIKDIQHFSNSKIDISKSFDIISDFKPDIVLHAAGKAHSVPKGEQENKEFLEVNFNGTKNFCKALERSNNLPKIFVFISSVAVYGMNKGYLIDEQSQTCPNTPYGKSKLLSETFLNNWAIKNNIKLFIFRLPLVAGKGAPGNLGDMIESIRKRRYFRIGNGMSKKSIVWAEDLANLINNIFDYSPGIFNLTDGYDPSFLELENAIASVFNYKKIIKLPDILVKLIALFGNLVGNNFPLNTDKLEKITSTLTFSNEKAKADLEWRPSKVLDKINEMIID